MRLFDRLFTRRRRQPSFAQLPDGVRRRLAIACGELSDAEDRISAQLGLARPPRLLLIDEESGVVVLPKDRAVAVRAASPP